MPLLAGRANSMELLALPLVTVMIPAFNHERYISDAVLSALAQDYPRLEVVACDDCSTDGTAAILLELKEKDARLKVFANETNMGRVANYKNLLYKRASGEWVINLDGDDFFTDSTFVSRFVAALELCGEATIVFGDMLMGDDGASTKKRKINAAPRVLDGTEYILSWPRARHKIQHASCMYKRSCALSLNFYSKDIASSDYESLFRLALGHKIIYCPGEMAVWRSHENNVTKNMSVCDKIDDLSLFESVADFALSFLPECSKKEWRKWKERNIRRRIYVNTLAFALKKDKGGFSQYAGGLKKTPYRRLLGRVCLDPITHIKIARKKIIRMVKSFK